MGEDVAKTAERLHKRIAASGICSRRAAEELIAQGRVEVNGSIVTSMGVKVTEADRIEVDGKALPAVHRPIVLAMHKPPGYVTTLKDPFRRRTVADLLPAMDAVVKPIGRLDFDSEGLLLFTNDGLLAARLTHPRFGVEKEYIALVQGEPTERDLERLRTGIAIGGKKTSPAVVERLEEIRGNVRLRFVIHEGRKRQIRLMCQAVGRPVLELKRTRVGSVNLGRLPRGRCRILSTDEADGLRRLVGLA